jgi:hypothetical protein
MNFLKSFFTEYDIALSELMDDAGFSAEQTKRFLPVAASGIADAFHNKEIEHIISAFGSRDPSLLLNEIDIDAIADKADMNSEQVTAALNAIAPLITHAFKHNSDGMVGAAISIAWESKRDFISIAKRLFN